MQGPCFWSADANNSVARVFQQDPSWNINTTITCLQFATLALGSVDVTLELFVDSSGGEPNYADMTLMGGMSVKAVNAWSYQVQTATFASPVDIQFNNKESTLVVVMSFPTPSVSIALPAGSFNEAATGTSDGTYVGGSCLSGSDPDFISWLEYNNGDNGEDDLQWFVKLSGTGEDDSDDDWWNSDSKSNTCFSGDSLVAMSDGSQRAVADLRIGDSVLAAAADGSVGPADVVFLPHL
jgi:hypothetical protein